MFNIGKMALHLSLGGFTLSLVMLGAIGTASAQGIPRSFVASPEIYKVAAQNDKYLVIEVIWKPGQRDQSHSHPSCGTYFLADCRLRFFLPDGTTREASILAGRAFAQEPIASHEVENIGTSDCKLVMVEPR